MRSKKAIRNIGVLAHVDAGKTTLTEQLLFSSGAIRSAGRVDHGTSLTDSLEVERERGITVKAASAALNWRDVNIRIIDTPGHADFYPEVERSIRVLDGAVLVVSAVEGIQLQTLNIWSALRELNVPTIIFVNKLDRAGADPENLLRDLSEQLSPHCLPMQLVEAHASKSARVVARGDTPSDVRQVMEYLGNVDDKVMEQYVADTIMSATELQAAIARNVSAAIVFPVYFGVALSGLGVSDLLNAVVEYLPAPRGEVDNPLSAVVYKIECDDTHGRLLHVRVFEGSISERQQVYNKTLELPEKVLRLQTLATGGGLCKAGSIGAGDIGIVSGMKSTRVGHILGDGYAVPDLPTPTKPMLVAGISPKENNQWKELLEALQLLEDEDPLLSIDWREQPREINLRFFGEVQMEIVQNILSTRFKIESEISDPGVIYKQSPVSRAEANIVYRDGGYADLTLRVEPRERGSGFSYQSLISGDNKIYQKFMKQIPQLLEQTCMEGINGKEVTDIKVTLVDGYCKYDLGTQANDYKIVTPMVLKWALERADMSILEPIMDFEIRVPTKYGAAVYRDLLKMRATIEQQTTEGSWQTFSGAVPFAETYKSTALLYASSHGQGVLKTKFSGYFPVGA